MVTSLSQEPDAFQLEWMSRFVADIPSAVALFDRERRYLAANHAWLEAFSIAGERLIGQSHDHVDPRSAPDFAELHRRALTGETAETTLAGEEDLVGAVRRRLISVRPR